MEKHKLAMFDDGILKPHNQQVYQKILDGLLDSNKVLVEQATGTGKSFLAMKYIHDFALNNGKKVLFVAPTKVIEDAFLDNCEGVLGYGKNGNFNVDLTTSLYAGLKNEVNNHYDIIILDEVHRAGAEVWGQSVEQLLANNSNATVLGLTATLDRMDGIDIRQYFDNREPVSRISLVNAIQSGILPVPDYTLAKVDFSDDKQFIEQAEQDLMDKLHHATRNEKAYITKYLADLSEAKKIIAESKELPYIFGKELNTPALRKGKYIVFCIGGQDDNGDKLRMEQMATQAHYWFKSVEGNPSVRTYAVHSTYGSEYNAEQIEEFENDDSNSIKLLFSVNMLNEGKHVEDIDGVIMFRPTASKVIYLQQLGRALSVGHNEHPKIFDFVANLDMERVDEIKRTLTPTQETEHTKQDGDEVQGDRDKGKPVFNINIKNLTALEFINSLKRNIYEFNETFDFDLLISKLNEYKAENGDLLVPYNYETEDHYSLGRRVIELRSTYRNGKLSQDRIDELSKIGFVWSAKDEAFEEGFARLKEYQAENGDLLVPADYETEDQYPLGQKVNNIRQSFRKGKLSQDKIDRLNEIGFIWNTKDEAFEEFCARLEEYKQKSGDLLVPLNYETEDQYPLGQKVSYIRQSYSRGYLSSDKKNRLNAIGFVWNTRGNVKGETFEETCTRLEKYKQENGDLSVPGRYKTKEDQYPLGVKVYKIRASFKKGKLSQDKIDRLNEMGFVWSAKDEVFEEFCTKLEEYQAENGDLLVPTDYETEDHYLLGRRVKYIRQLFKNGDLSSNKIDRLNEMGFVWESSKKIAKDEVFEEFCTKLEEYQAENGDLVVPSRYKTKEDQYPLGQKVSGIRQAYKTDRLSQEKIDRLNEMGFVWEGGRKINNDETFEVISVRLEKYKQENGDLVVPRNYETEDQYPLGLKVHSIRVAYKNGRLSSDKIDYLNEMGFVWDASKKKKDDPQMQ